MAITQVNTGSTQGEPVELKKLYTLFWFGIIIYMLGFTLSVLNNPIYILCDLMRLFGIGCFVWATAKLVRFNPGNQYIKVMYFFYMLWLMITVLRGLKPDYEFIKNTLFNPFSGLFLYFVPLLLLFPKTAQFYKTTFKAISVLGILFLVLTIISIGQLRDLDFEGGRDLLEYFVKILSLPSGILVMTYCYQTRRKKTIAFMVMAASVLLATFRARRGLMFMSGSVFIFTFFIFVYRHKEQLAAILLGIIVAIFFSFYAFTLFNSGNSYLLGKAKERLDEDTRTEVEVFFFRDMQVKDWLIGRGMAGLVAAPPEIDPSEEHPGYRDGVETDYLTIMLKGGVISLGLLLAIAIPAMVQGLFLSKNTLSKAAGFWILLWLLSLYPSTVTSFTVNYMLVWISIGICYSKTILNMPDALIAEYLGNTKKHSLKALPMRGMP